MPAVKSLRGHEGHIILQPPEIRVVSNIRRERGRLSGRHNLGKCILTVFGCLFARLLVEEAYYHKTFGLLASYARQINWRDTYHYIMGITSIIIINLYTYS